MNLLNEDFFNKLRKKRNNFLIIFIIMNVVFLVAYILSFFSNALWPPMLVSISSVIISVLFFYGMIFDKNKLLRFYNDVLIGVTQNDTYVFKKEDGYTEHDGVRLLRLTCTFEDEGEVFERTLYFLIDLPHPQLSEGQQITVKTHRNVIIDIKD